MKIGDYIRFKDKNGSTYIRKIIDLPKDKRYGAIQIDKSANYSDMVSPKNIIGEPKEKLIDLIEDGDYVNGDKVLEILSHSPQLMFTTYKYYGHHYTKILNNEDIKTIVTHEQFKNMEYEVK